MAQHDEAEGTAAAGLSVIDSMVVVRDSFCPARIGEWNCSLLPAHIRRGSPTGGMNPPSFT